MKYHSLLNRQIEKHLVDKAPSPEWQKLLNSINNAYIEQFSNYSMLERSLDKAMEDLERTNKDLKNSQKEIEHIAFHDTLTGLPNRNLLKDRFEQLTAHALRHDKKVAIFYLDLDHFKNLNDTQGHLAGDHFLIKVAELLKSSVRKEDTVGRIGGDEFVLLLGDLDHVEEAIGTAKNILAEMQKPFDIDGYEVHSGFSIGIAFFPDDGKDMKTVFKNADIAMYQAKKKGRNNYQLFISAMNEKIIHRMNTEQKLRKAIKRDELMLHYQPKVEIATGKVVGLEALLRWKHPSGELFMPDQFILIAENCNLVFPLGEWVINSVCQQIKIWEKLKIPIAKIAINLSGRQIEQLGFVKSIKKILDQVGVHPDTLELEVTETSLMHNTSTVVKTLNELKTMGFHLTIDDFGSGYSSLKYLTQLPFQTLKIDKTYISQYNEKSVHAIIRAIIILCKDLGLTVIAEGVETTEQLAFLRENDCDQYQGYLFCKPLTPDKINEFNYHEIAK